MDISHDDVVALLKIGTVVEVAQRAAKARTEKGAKAQWAKDAYEALRFIEEGGYVVAGKWVDLHAAVCRSVAGSIFYAEPQWRPAKLAKPSFLQEQCIEVHNGTALAALQLLACSGEPRNTSPGVLNFASARNPGGGFTTGAAAQEETLARSSALYPCLTKYFDDFFVPSRRAESGSYTHSVIYSPDVPVFRDDSGTLLDSAYVSSFVTAAAPNVGSMRRTCGDAEAEAAAVLQERIPRVLDVFARHGVVDLVLGAWGCGVFGNSPKVVASIFARELRGRFQGHFRHVIFAVLDASMAQVFAEELSTDVVPPASEFSKWGAQRKWGIGDFNNRGQDAGHGKHTKGGRQKDKKQKGAV